MPSSWATVTDDERQSARLLFEPNWPISCGRGGADSARGPERRPLAAASRPALLRVAQALAAKGKRDAYESWVLEPQMAARRAVLGDAGAGAAAVARAPGRVPGGEGRGPERAELGRRDLPALPRDHGGRGGARTCSRCCPAPAGTISIRTPGRPAADRRGARAARPRLRRGGRARRPRAHPPDTERVLRDGTASCAGCLGGRLADLLDRADAELAESRSAPLDLRASLQPLPTRGSTPSWRSASPSSAAGPRPSGCWASRARRWCADGAVYVPSYPPFYGIAARDPPRRAPPIELQPGTWVPLTLHLGWEACRGWSDLERLARLVAPYARPWGALLGALDRPVDARGARRRQLLQRLSQGGHHPVLALLSEMRIQRNRELRARGELAARQRLPARRPGRR